MIQAVTSYRLWSVFAACCLLTVAAPAVPASDATEKQASPAKAIRDQLSKPVALEKGFAENTPLKEALEFLSDRFDIQIIVNGRQFQALGLDSVEGRPVQLPKISGVKLVTLLQLLLAQIPASYLLHRDYIEIVPLEGAHPQSWSQRRDLAATVQTAFTDCPLDEALRELAEASGISVVLDCRAGAKARTNVTATLNNVPIDTAVLLLADMADLRPVALDNVLYVTSKENARQLLAWQEQQCQNPPGTAQPCSGTQPSLHHPDTRK